jgi:hypothetical protein
MKALSVDDYDPEANTGASRDILRKLITELAVETDYLAACKRILKDEKKVKVYYA